MLAIDLTGHISDCVDKLSLQTDKKNVLDINAVKKYVTSLPNDESVRKMIDGDITDCYDYSVSHWLFLPHLSLAIFYGLFSIWQNCDHSLLKFYAAGQIFIAEKSQKLKE